MTDPGLIEALRAATAPERVLGPDAAVEDYTHDECLTVEPRQPLAVVLPVSTEEVAAVVRVAATRGVAITARGSGTGLSGAATPAEGSIVVSFERMNAVLELDPDNHTAVVQPGVRLNELDEVTAAAGLTYPVYPGEYSASLGGNIATNAGGMRAVKYGVTRHQVLGLELVLADGQIIRTGGKFVKATTGYDLTQLVIGSEGTLALVTEATLRLYPRAAHQATVLAPFATLDEVTAAVPRIIDSGVGPLILEYIDILTMSAVSSFTGLELGIPTEIKDTALAYLVVMLEHTDPTRLDDDITSVAEQLAALGAIDAYILPPAAAAHLIHAREKAFWMAKAAGADDVVDIVVPRAQIPDFMEKVQALAGEYDAWIAGCGHAGDGNVHLGIFCADEERRSRLLTALFSAGVALGGAISGEHGIGEAKQAYFLELEDPTKVALMRRIKTAFDPDGILNPATLLG